MTDYHEAVENLKSGRYVAAKGILDSLIDAEPTRVTDNLDLSELLCHRRFSLYPSRPAECLYCIINLILTIVC